MKLKSIRDIKFKPGQRVLLRVAYDVPLELSRGKWRVANDARIRQTLPTLRYLLKQKVVIGIVSSLGRPEGKRVTQYQMDPVASALRKLIRRPVTKLDDCIGPKVFDRLQRAKPGEILLLENTRFYHDEERNGRQFAKLLSHGFDVCVFDAFAQAHRMHASTIGIIRRLPTVIGFLVEAEIAALEKLLHQPKHPFVVVMGGAKISDKVGTLRRLLPKADAVLIGGGMENIFLKAKKVSVGASLVESPAKVGGKVLLDPVRVARQLLSRYSTKIQLPIDLVAASSRDAKAISQIVDFSKGDAIQKGWQFLDIGPQTAAAYAKTLRSAKTIFWNGPLGICEQPRFCQGTQTVARAMAANRGMTVAGGGDTEATIEQFRLTKKFNHISSGGGAALEFLAHGTLPVLHAIEKM
jgi:phosphoglycerate kinase